MLECRLGVFDADGTNPRLRWWTPGATLPAERQLQRGEITNLIDEATSRYHVRDPDLVALGQLLYRWLDGPTERWLQAMREEQQPFVLRISGDERLRGLPWELIHDGGFLTVDPFAAITPVRLSSPRQTAHRAPCNRPLRVLFMACSPIDVEPVLDFEAEEAGILRAAAGRLDLVVEESGSLAGLAETLNWFGEDHFDVIHLSGHAALTADGPRFLMESETGARHDVSAQDIGRAIRGRWPQVVFLSGCWTGLAPDQGAQESMAEALVQAGAPRVLGWALPVGDLAASRLEAELYKDLANGTRMSDAVTNARRTLREDNDPCWHLLRAFSGRCDLDALVTAPGTRGRSRLHRVHADALFLDAEGRVKVASREGFVGRRRELQRLLRSMRPADPSDGPAIALLTGMGGLGKSALAARLLQRMGTTHKHTAVWVGAIDRDSVKSLRLRLSDLNVDVEVNKIMAQDLPLADRLRYVLDGPLADEACVFLFDDFEDGNLQADGVGGHLCTPASLEVLTAFATAIAHTASPSRVIVTSRYAFPLPVEVRRLDIGPLEGADLDKKLRLTKNLRLDASTPDELRTAAISASAGIPRLIERVDSLLDAAGDDLSDVLIAVQNTQEQYREELMLKSLLDAQPSSYRRWLALAGVYEIAVPVEAILALDETDGVKAIDQLVASSLLQCGIHPGTGELRYLVSPLLRPLLEQCDERLSDGELLAAQAKAARFLYERWVGHGQ